jgi:ribosomal protein L37E
MSRRLSVGDEGVLEIMGEQSKPFKWTSMCDRCGNRYAIRGLQMLAGAFVCYVCGFPRIKKEPPEGTMDIAGEKELESNVQDRQA